MNVCQFWRELIKDTTLFWTTIWVFPTEIMPASQYLPRLKFLIERTGSGSGSGSSSIPLRIVWDATPHLGTLQPSQREALYWYFFEHVPFSRLKYLDVYKWDVRPKIIENSGYFHGPSILKKLDIRGILECKDLLNALEKSTTRIPHIQLHHMFDQLMQRRNPKLFDAVTTLSADTVIPLGITKCQNVTTLNVYQLPDTPCRMPRLRTLYIKDGFEFADFAIFDVPSLQNLHIEFIEDGGRMQPVLFPHLLSLTISSGELWPLSLFQADNLNTLCVEKPLASLKNSNGIVVRLLSEFNYKLSPSTLILNTPLEIPTIVWFLRRSPRINSLSVLLDIKVKSDFKELVKQIVSRWKDVQGNKLVDKWHLCPDLTTLELRLDWQQQDTNYWMTQAQKILRGRSIGIMESVTCEWSDGNRITVTMKQVMKAANAAAAGKAV